MMAAWRLVLLLSILIGQLSYGQSTPDPLLTKAESSNYQATSTHAEVMAFCKALATESPRVTLTTMGNSHEGRNLPLLIMSEHGISKPDDRLTVLCVGNIHAGEVCGKEALMMLARDLARADKPGILTNLNVLIAPIYNADGNEPFHKDNRPGQVGPAHGMGQRANAEGLDLNRDYIKLEAPETRALVRLYREWDPSLVIDTHTTNGSQHRYTLTYGGPRHPATGGALVDYMRETFLPKVGEKLKASSGYNTFFYGNFADEHQRWETYPALPRYGAHYLGLRQRLAILSEAYSYVPYKDRVLCTRDFVHECLKLSAKRHKRLSKLVISARKKALKAPVALRHQLGPFDDKRLVKGKIDGEAKDFLLEYWGKSKATLSADQPYAYLIPANCANIAANLQHHGIEVDELREDTHLTVHDYTLSGVERAEQPFQKHHLVSIERADSKKVRRQVPAGTLLVKTKQDLGALAVFLLEPYSEDGLLTWNFMDEHLGEDGRYPVSYLKEEIPLLTTAARPVAEEREMEQRVTFEMLYGKNAPNLNGKLTSVRWLDDGKSALQTLDGQLYRVDVETGKRSRFFSHKKLKKSLESLAVIDDDEATRLSKRNSWTMNPQRTAAVFEFREDLYHLPFDGSPASRLTNTSGLEELAEFSPDGAFIAFVRGHNLHVVDVASQTETALSTDGNGDDISNGKAAWVYFEELYGRSWKAFWWSPDSRHLAFHRFDSSRLPMFRALNTLPLHGEIVAMRHPKSGDPNPDIQLGVAHVAGGTTKWVDLSAYTEGTFIVSHVGWMPTGDDLYYYVQDRAQTWLDFLTSSKTGGKGTVWFRDTTKAWVESPGDAHAVEDGVIIASERTGWRHLYHYHRKNKTWRALTEGSWEVRTVHHVDDERGKIYFSGTKDSHLAENLYRCDLHSGQIDRLTEGHNAHRVSLDPTGTYFTDNFSDHQTPSKLQLRRCDDGALVRTLDTNPVYKLEELALTETEFLQVPTRDGVMLEAMLIKPKDFDPEKRYPVWFQTYAGPHAPVVREGWSRSRLSDQMLVNQGLIVFRLDPRSASGKGAQSAWTAYRQLGTQEMKDITDGIEWLKEKPCIDATRIGMSGHSYGGYMTAYAMTHSKLFAAGISGAPVTDWHYYDSIYTERYMDTPQNNPDGYQNSSVITAAKDLHGKLLLLHGLMDDNVHLQNATQLIKALQDADKSFDVMVYPEMKHGLHGTHYQRLKIDFISNAFGLANE